MCELFAVNARHAEELNAWLKTFFGDSVMHPDGWGIATRDNLGEVSLVKEAMRAVDSELLRSLLAEPVRASHLLAHIRYATFGAPSHDNCHPFVGTDATGTEWSFIHNGSIFHPEAVECFVPLAAGTSDSELVMLFLLDSINHATTCKNVGQDGRFDALLGALAELSRGNKLNVIMDDGTYTYVHTNTAENTLYYKVSGDAAFFCTRPLDANGWQPLPTCSLLAFRDGKLVRSAETGGTLYHTNQQELDAFVLAHAA